MNLYILGDIRNAYRTQLFIKTLMNNNIMHIAVNSIKDKNLFQRIVKFIVNTVMLIQSDVVYVCAIQHNSKLLRLAKLMHKKIILEFYVSFYDTEIYDRKKYSEESKQAKKFKRIDKFAIRSADKVIFLNKSEAIYYSKILGFDLDEINYSIIPVCVSKKPKAKLNFFKADKKIIDICWVGTYIPLQGVDKIIAAASILKKNNIPFRITLWGDSWKKAEPYIEEIKKRNLENYFYINNDDWGNLGKWENYIKDNCDVTLGIFGDSKKAKTVIANKVMDGLAFKTPLVTGRSNGLNEYFDGKNDIFLTENSPQGIADAIIKIVNTPSNQILERVEYSNLIFLSNFTYGAFEDRFMDIFIEMGLVKHGKN